MPLKIEIILPAAELSAILPEIEEMVTDGIVVVEDMDIRSHRTKERLIPRQIQVKKELIRQTTMKTAAEVMKTDVLTVREDTRIEEAIRIMAEKGIKRLPVIDEKGIFKGMVSRDAVLRAGIGQ